MTDRQRQVEAGRPAEDGLNHMAAQAIGGLERELAAAEALEAKVEQLLSQALSLVKQHKASSGEVVPYGAQHLRAAILDFQRAVDDLYGAQPLDLYILRLKRVISSLEAALTGETPISKAVALAQQLEQELADHPQEQPTGWEDL